MTGTSERGSPCPHHVSNIQTPSLSWALISGILLRPCVLYCRGGAEDGYRVQELVSSSGVMFPCSLGCLNSIQGQTVHSPSSGSFICSVLKLRLVQWNWEISPWLTNCQMLVLKSLQWSCHRHLPSKAAQSACALRPSPSSPCVRWKQSPERGILVVLCWPGQGKHRVFAHWGLWQHPPLFGTGWRTKQTKQIPLELYLSMCQPLPRCVPPKSSTELYR